MRACQLCLARAPNFAHSLAHLIIFRSRRHHARPPIIFHPTQSAYPERNIILCVSGALSWHSGLDVVCLKLMRSQRMQTLLPGICRLPGMWGIAVAVGRHRRCQSRGVIILQHVWILEVFRFGRVSNFDML